MSEQKITFQSNDNYPWEYSEQVEIWMSDLSQLNTDRVAAETKPKKAAVQPAEEIGQGHLFAGSEAKPLTEAVSEEKISELFEQSIEAREQTLAAIKARGQFSWILSTVVLLIIIVAGEITLSDVAQMNFWSVNFLWLLVWCWRLLLLLVWLWFALKKWQLQPTKVYAATLSAYVLAVLVSAIWKITINQAVWTWLNLFTEPVWTILMVALIGSLFSKFILPDKYDRYKS